MDKNKLFNIDNIICTIGLLISFIIMFIHTYYLSLTYVCPNHIGSMFKMAVDVSDGMHIYGQTYSQYGPLPTWIQAIAIKLFGKHVIVIGMTTLFFSYMMMFTLQLIWRRFIPAIYVLCAILIQTFLLPGHSFPWPNAYMQFFVVLTLLLLLKYSESNNFYILFMAGVSSAAAALCRQQGFILPLFVFIYFLYNWHRHKNTISQLKNTALYLLGFITTISVFFMYLNAFGLFNDYYIQTIKIIPTAYAGSAKSILVFDNVIELISFLYSKVGINLLHIWILPILASTVYLLLSVINKNINNNNALFLCALLSIWGWLNAYPLPDDFRYGYGLAPAVGVITYFVFLMFTSRHKAINFMASVFILTLTFGGAIHVSWRTTVAYYNHLVYGMPKTVERVNSPSVIKGCYLSHEEADLYASLSEFIDEYLKLFPDTKLISMGVEPLILTFISHNINAHQMPFYWWSKSGTMYDGGSKNTINSLLYQEYDQVVSEFVLSQSPLLYTYGQKIDGFKPVFSHLGAPGIPVYWATQWVAVPIVSIQAPNDRADKFLSAHTTRFLSIPPRISISDIRCEPDKLAQDGYPTNNTLDNRLDTFTSFISNDKFIINILLCLENISTVSKITLMPRNGFAMLLPKYITIEGSDDGNSWNNIIASYNAPKDMNYPYYTYEFNSKKIKYLRLGMCSNNYFNQELIQISEILVE